MSGPVPGTPTPWSMDALNPGEIELTGAPNGFCADIIGHIKDWSTETAQLDAAAIVHRVNNWDAEQAKLAALVALADRAIASVESAVRETSWGQPTFGPDAGEELRAEFVTLTTGEQP